MNTKDNATPGELYITGNAKGILEDEGKGSQKLRPDRWILEDGTARPQPT